MSQNLSDDEDMISSPSSPATPVNATAHLPAHLDLKTPPQSQDNTPYTSRIGIQPTSAAAPTSAATLTSTSAASTYDLENPVAEITPSASTINTTSLAGGSVATGGRRRQSQMTLTGAQAGGNSVSIMQSTEAGVPMWLTKRGLEEIHNIEERLLDRQFSTHMYGSIFNDKDMALR
ncbi:hypothetical protein TWF481_003367 [Arthrobotrys musiformis]|uniref:Uncharacterized protein n=1 Tax=Arthrobotrys musiformis TaxID=47236 RepID=A0AAV9VR44_9PEZI